MDGFPLDLIGYSPVELIASGPSRLVFKARQRSTGQFVAVKTLPPDCDGEAVERFCRFGRLMACFSHPHIAALIDAGRDAGGLPYIISEFVPGETLRRVLLRNGPLEIELACALMGQLLDALACIHAHGVVHRDIKPQNVMVSSAGARANIKLIDFDIAASTAVPDEVRPPAAGTPGYCPPEQLRGAAPTPAADLYAWGLLFIECLTGRPAVDGLSAGDRWRAQTGAEPIAFPARLRGHRLEPLLREVLSNNPQERAGDALALHARVQKVLAQIAAAAVPGDPAPPAPAAPSSLRATASPGPVLCISLGLTPLARVSVDPNLLAALQDQEQHWCLRTVLGLGGEAIGAVGDRQLFRFEAAGADEGTWRAAQAAVDLRAEIARRGRLLELQYGVRLRLRAGLHAEDPRDAANGGLNRSAGIVLRLAERAQSGAIRASPATLRRLRRLMRFDRDEAHRLAEPSAGAPLQHAVRSNWTDLGMA